LEHSFEEKISEAEVILLVKVLEVRRDLAGEDGVYSSAALEVLDVIKGDISGSPLQLVMSSAIPAADPKCCKVDSEYLVFARKGLQGWLSRTKIFVPSELAWTGTSRW